MFVGKHGMGMGTKKCAKNPSAQTGLRKNKQTGNYEKVNSQTMPTGACYDEGYDRKGVDTDIDPTRSIDNVAVELDENGNIIEYDYIPENAEKFKAETYENKLDNLRKSMNEERQSMTNAKGKPYGVIRDDAVEMFAITIKPEMAFFRELSREQQKQYLRDSYECMNKFMHETMAEKGIDIPLQSGIMHFDELNPHMHTYWTFTNRTEKGLPSFAFKQAFTPATYKNMQSKVRTMMNEKGWNLKEVIPEEELTPEQRRERQVKSGRSSLKIKEDYEKENQELQQANEELQEANKLAEKDLAEKMEKASELPTDEQIETQKKEYETTKTKVEEAKVKKANLEKENKSLKNKNKTVENKLLNKEIKILDEKEIQKQLKQKNKELEKENQDLEQQGLNQQAQQQQLIQQQKKIIAENEQKIKNQNKQLDPKEQQYKQMYENEKNHSEQLKSDVKMRDNTINTQREEIEDLKKELKIKDKIYIALTKGKVGLHALIDKILHHDMPKEVQEEIKKIEDPEYAIRDSDKVLDNEMQEIEDEQWQQLQQEQEQQQQQQQDQPQEE